MALLVRIYFNAVFGGLGGLLGWLVFGVFGDPTRSSVPQWVLGGLLIGGFIGYLVVSVDAIRDRSLIRFCRLGSYGVVLGAAGGALGMLIGEGLNALLNRLIGATPEKWSTLHFLGFAFCRGLGWLVLGLGIGVSEGIAARSLRKLSYGIMGGLLGGFIGGALYGAALYLKNLGADPANRGYAYFAVSALGLVILGACIGSLSAFVQAVLQPASVKVMRGWQEGREYPLLKDNTLLGRDEHADIALFRDMKVEKRHAFIKRQGNRFILWNNNSPPEQTLVNDDPVAHSMDLKDGDRIQLGNVVLRFQMKAAQERRKRLAAPEIIGRGGNPFASEQIRRG